MYAPIFSYYNIFMRANISLNFHVKIIVGSKVVKMSKNEHERPRCCCHSVNIAAHNHTCSVRSPYGPNLAFLAWKLGHHSKKCNDPKERVITYEYHLTTWDIDIRPFQLHNLGYHQHLLCRNNQPIAVDALKRIKTQI